MASFKLDISRLNSLIPVRDLLKEDQRILVDKVKMIDLLPGDRVNATDEHDWLFYLVEGEVVLHETEDAQSLIATDSRARYPLFNDQNSQAYIKVKTNSWFARFDRQLFNTLLEALILGDESFEATEIDGVESQLLNEMVFAFNNGQLELPALPEIALKVKAAIKNPDIEATDVARIIEADPVLATRLIQSANSALNQAMSPVRSIQEAVIRLGLPATRSMVISLSMKQLFTSKSEDLKQRMLNLYEHSVEIAAISAVLAKEIESCEVDQLLLAGLVHDIGVIPVLNYIEKAEYGISDNDELNRIIKTLRSMAGEMVIRSWELPVEIIDVIKQAENWERDSGEGIDMADIVILAHIYNMLYHRDVKHLPKIDQVPVYQKLLLKQQGQHSGLAEHILEHAKEEIAEIKQLLGFNPVSSG
ncbi:MAG: HDOD domain-containing protein [Gammaproteobacteria bacterium]|nr:HDOD domain-containing protein [Gammaproteobacteria bacterium]